MVFELLLLLGNLGATLFMTGVIWIIQVVHYPLFAAVGQAQFSAYERAHQERIALVVGPAMLLELLTSSALVVYRPDRVPPAALWAGAVLNLLLWISTALVQVPLHSRLAEGFTPLAHANLVESNWLRTATWSLRALLVLWMVARLSAR